LANGHPFEAGRDIARLVKDIGIAAGFGKSNLDHDQIHAERLQLTRAMHHSADSLAQDSNAEAIARFPEAEEPQLLNAVGTLSNILDESGNWPSQRLFYFIFSKLPRLRRVFSIFYRYTNAEIRTFVSKAPSGEFVQPASALEVILQGETSLSAKENRAPMYHSPRIRDEALSYMIGANTTTPVINWALKYLSKHQDIQRSIRKDLNSTYSKAQSEHRQPKASEIVTVPLFEAFIGEILRLHPPIPFLMKEALRDTTVLGHPAPKGTRVIFTITGVGITTKSLGLRDTDASNSPPSKQSSVIHSNWDNLETLPEQFHPGRWLRRDNLTGDVVFDPLQGPFLAFGTGQRACFGKKFAYLELRLVLTLLVWNFTFEELPDSLNTWDVDSSTQMAPTTCYVKLKRM
jgi:cytochrome P450